ncbi:MAG: hypothetical protein K2N38_14275 [Oscillospiraceae bacterium]|nr:hypothetical protein [Oscillospiraceae bacterium]
MTIERFVDLYGDDVYALALIVNKDFDSAARVFTQVAQDCEAFTEYAELFDVVQKAYALCKKAPSNDKAETFSEIGLSAKQESLLGEIFQRPQIVRAIIHLTYENDLTAEQTAKVTGAGVRYVTDQLSELSQPLSDRLEKSYKELCLRLTAPDELKADVIQAVNAGEKRLFEVRREAMPRHTWTKKQKTAAVIAAVAITALVCFIIPIVSEYLDNFEEMNSSYDEAPSDLIFSYTYEVGDASSE